MSKAHQALPQWNSAQASVRQSHALHWHLFTAPMRPPFDAFEQYFDQEQLAATTDWPDATIVTTDMFSGSPVVHSYPTLAQIAQHRHPCRRVDAMAYDKYELRDCCPTLRFIRIPDQEFRHE
jgi:hypothetical protein